MNFILIVIFTIGLFWFFWKYNSSSPYRHRYFWKGQKELKIWISEGVYTFLDIALWIIFMFAILKVYMGLSNENWLSAFFFFLIFLLPVSWRVIQSKYWINQNWTIESIQNIDKEGFEIQLIRNGKIQSTKKIQWKLIKRLSIKSNLKIFHENNERLTLDSSTEHYHTLLKNLPKYFPSITNQQINRHFKDLKSCLVCGAIAANYLQCEACGTYVWQKKFVKYYPNQLAYIKAKQLDLFASLHKNGLQRQTFVSDDTFKLNQNWKLVVTEKEIVKYGKKRFWVL